MRRTLELIVLSAYGCAPQPVDCAWLQGANCWKAAVSVVESCRPSPDAVGTFSADRRQCTYPSGETVSFAGPVGNPPRPPFNFSVGTCVTVEQPDEQTVRIKSRAGVATSRFTGQQLEITCPDGSVRVADLGPQTPLSGCERGEELLPDYYFGTGDPLNTASFGFRGANTATRSSTVWQCRPAVTGR